MAGLLSLVLLPKVQMFDTLGTKASISSILLFFKEASIWVDKGDVENLKKSL